MVRDLGPKGNNDGLDGGYWTHTCPIFLAMMVAEQVGVSMMKECFEIRASKSTPQYGFRKGLKLFGNEGYQAAKKNSRSTYSEEDLLVCYLGRRLRGISENKH